MPAYRTARVDEIIAERAGLQRVTLVGGGRAYVLTQLVGPVAAGDEVVLNTTAVDLGLGTGGWHVVHWNLSRREWSQPGPGHIMKLRYTSLQVDTGASEELDGEPPLTLDGTPVVAIGLHSQLAAVAVAFHEAGHGVAAAAASSASASAGDRPRLAYVMTDGGALPLALSDLVHQLVERRLLHTIVTCGHAFGGEYEAVNVHTGLLVARAHGADAIVAGIGPGVVGTGTAYGHTGLDVVAVLNAAAALGGRPILALRASDADERDRHRGVSHHTTEALHLLACEPETPTPGRGDDEATPDAIALFERHGLNVTSMGRPADEDRSLFQHAAAAGARAAELARPRN